MTKPGSAQLVDAMRARRLVRFARRFEDDPVRGYVLDVGPRFLLVALVSDRLWFDGFECFRNGDVKSLIPDPYAAFAESALRKRGERRPKKPRVNLESIDELLLSAGRSFPLVAIHRERTSPGICHIGRVLGVGRSRLSLLEISPDATWDESPCEYSLKEITRVSFGGDYENALQIVGGSNNG